MDDIFEQMLSSSPWAGDGATINPSLLGGSLEMNRGPFYEDNGRLPNEVMMFDPGNVHAIQAHPVWNQTFVGALSPSSASASASHGVLGCGKQEGFLGDPLRDLHRGKRPRDEDDIIDCQRNLGIQGFGDQGTTINGGGKPRVRARRGQATDPHSIAERNRRERIAERMKALQELVPDSNKTDKASMLDEIIGYVKFLQMQVKCLSMCRLGGAGATAPLLSDLPTEGGDFLAANLGQGNGGGGDGIALAEHQVARLMDEDMSAAMQYLQSKGLCLMPISLATVISSSVGRHPQSSCAGPSNSSDGGADSIKQAMELAASFAASVGATTQTSASMTGALSSFGNSKFLGREDVGNVLLKGNLAINNCMEEISQRDDGGGDDINDLNRPSTSSLHNSRDGIKIRQDIQR